jgi:hypothetical protein
VHCPKYRSVCPQVLLDDALSVGLQSSQHKIGVPWQIYELFVGATSLRSKPKVLLDVVEQAALP